MNEYCYIIREIEDELYFRITPRGLAYTFKPHRATMFDTLNTAKHIANVYQDIKAEILYCLIA